ncbi:hypothetical protein AX15_004494 [Amanita polypyramis BW_CC]|nr:hypothetical protein AX15_004494 [Amanita polypyramis BW_CC]
MPQFNIFRALTKKAQVTDISSAKQSQGPSNPQLSTSRKPRTLTKRKHVSGQSQPSYNVRSEDIGYYELGRYPSNMPMLDPTPSGSNLPQYADTHLEETRLEYPTMTNESFHPINQSSKRWSPVPDVYRESATLEYGDAPPGNESDGPHRAPSPVQGPSQHGHPRDPRLSVLREHIESNDDIPVSGDGSYGGYGHGIIHDPRELTQSVRLADPRAIRYVQESTTRGEVPYHEPSMRALPVNSTDRGYSMRDAPHTEHDERGFDPNVIEPVIFEHQVLRNDGSSKPMIWHYIVPGGLDVVFQDEDGNELTRVRNIGDNSTRRRVTPMVIEDEFGNVVYRTGDFDSLSGSSHTKSESERPQREYPYESRYQKTMERGKLDSEPIVRAPVWLRQRSGSPNRHVYTSYLSPEAEKVILIDKHGRQIPIADRRERSTRRVKHLRGA